MIPQMARQLRFVVVVALFALGGGSTQAAGLLGIAEDDPNWQEQDVSFPDVPKDAGWVAFDPGAATAHRYYVDLPSLTVGADGVVRYVLLVQSQGGARNVRFEGMRCSTKEWRLYATLRRDGAWVKSRNESWDRLRDGVSDQHRVSLFADFFCPGGVIVRDVFEARDALRKGGHPDNHLW